MKKIKIAYILNIILLIFEIFSIGWMMSGITVSGSSNELMAARLSSFKYFTVDSNALLGIITLLLLVNERQILKGTKKEISKLNYILKLLGTVGVTLTMLVTLFFLAPTMGPQVIYLESNLFLHVLNPVLSIIILLFFERNNKIDFKHTFTAIIPVLIYSVYYVVITLVNTTGGVIKPGYDWYGFFMFGIKSVVIVLPIMYIITYIISVVLWKLNRSK